MQINGNFAEKSNASRTNVKSAKPTLRLRGKRSPARRAIYICTASNVFETHKNGAFVTIVRFF